MTTDSYTPRCRYCSHSYSQHASEQAREEGHCQAIVVYDGKDGDPDIASCLCREIGDKYVPQKKRAPNRRRVR